MIYVLSGGVGGKLFAIIGVTYPSGSTCTCTNGAKTLTAKDTSGTALFVIPEAGTWTVTAVSGDKTASKAVSITAEGQVENVELTYSLLLIHNGIVQSNTFSVFNGTATTFETVGPVFRVALARDISAYFEDIIDFGKINSVEITLAGGRAAYNVTFGLISTKTAYSASSGAEANKNIFNVASVVFTGNPISAVTKAIDVSSIYGSYYLGVTLSGSNGISDAAYNHGGFDISKIELI